MCGIVGYTGKYDCSSFIFSGLKTLEYRGYDSAGIAIINNGKTSLLKREGKISILEKAFNDSPINGYTGIGHTRWATHGKPDQSNAHPHQYKNVTVAHNGIIENYLQLKQSLQTDGHVFISETDSEIISHLIYKFINEGENAINAVWKTTNKLKGTWAIAVLIEGYENSIFCTRNGSPLIIGKGENENVLASDIPALLSTTRNMIFLEDGDIAAISNDNIDIFTDPDHKITRPVKIINWNPIMAEKGGYKHFMLKEIFEQPRAIADTIGERLDKENNDINFQDFDIDVNNLHKIIIVACGTSFYAATIGKYIIEKTSRINVEIDIGSEFRYRDPIISENDLIIAISQSGETADTLAAVKLAKRKGAKILTVSNVLDSQIPRISDYKIYTHAGPEIGVASTKAFTAQLAVMVLLGIYFGKKSGNLNNEELQSIISSFLEIPGSINSILDHSAELQVIAKRYQHSKAFLYIARGINFPIALEGALKLKEISYIHAEGYPAGEMKHGPIALIDEDLPVVAIATNDDFLSKVVSNMQEVKSRGGPLIAIATQGNRSIGNMVEDLFLIPETHDLLLPLLTVIPLQLLAYYTADLKGTDVDQPRNLAKSVTVE